MSHLVQLIHVSLAAAGCVLLLNAAQAAAQSTRPARPAPTASAPGAKPPFWAEHGVFAYRVSTPDDPNMLPQTEAGAAMVAHLLDGSVPQILLMNGIVGHDHRGPWNWDGLWPYWNRVTFRANNDWKTLSDFMVRMRDRNNALVSFHVNLTDVNIGLRDYPETREFFAKLVAAKAIYRREYNPQTRRYDIGEPYVPQEIDRYIKGDDKDHANPVPIFALVNYQNFWKSGLAKEMIDAFYLHLPYAPPFLYLDVFNLGGGNFSTGYPDGPLGGGRETQLDGAISIIEYLRSKGTDLATEGERPDFGNRAGYVWLHGRGFSADDYSRIAGGSAQLVAQHVLGNPGAFNVSPIASTPAGLEKVKAHYAALLSGQPGTKVVATPDTWRLAYRSGDKKDEFDIPGTGDPFRGDWADLVNNYYLTTIQENYHIGNRATRKSSSSIGVIHLGKYTLASPSGQEITISVPDFVTGWTARGARASGQVMLESPITTRVTVPAAGRYAFKITYKTPNRSEPRLNVYANDQLQRTFENIPSAGDWGELKIEDMPLNAGENTLSFDAGPIRANWTDGTTAEWTTPYLRKGFKASNGDVIFADDYDRMWPDTWSGQKKIYFFSWDGAARNWKLPADWANVSAAMLYPLTPDGRGTGMPIKIADRTIQPELRPQVPYVLAPVND